MIAKFWIEAALGKLPSEGTKSAIMSANASKEMPTINGVGSSVIEKARLEIMEALVTTEFRMGNIDGAFEIINKLLRQHPRSEFFRKVRAQMENELEKSTANSKDKKQKKK
ncbi:PREDICTED: uncharacterized protein LOC108361456, partial [Rhagoletis zephyria]|uniref:uncharacterized protein LOC108361456 n=1 Tax=Rhagoletis zephyria TaxID=28612 RepID=UPI00081140C9